MPVKKKAAAEWAMHLTGKYPTDWQGRTFDRPVRFWASGVTSQSTRDNPQRLLIGPPANETAWGTGTIPKQCLMDWSRACGIADALDTVSVRHISGGISTLTFKSYEMGRAKWQGETLDGVWFDEEPPLEIYSEGADPYASARVVRYAHLYTPSWALRRCSPFSQ